MRKLTATILTTAFLAGGVGAGAALAAPVHHRSDAVRTEQRDRSHERSHHVERAHSDREAGRTR
ncbi:MAG TPA: hypothetical protein VIU44_00815 [Gaiellaceae bacterium]